MDNLGSHKGNAVETAINAAGARLLYLPTYSPDFNPIEKASSKPSLPTNLQITSPLPDTMQSEGNPLVL
jgi:hypothetical protein